MMTDDRNWIHKGVLGEAEYMTETRRHFHQFPELSMQEVQTAAYIRKQLKEWEIPFYENDVANTVAVIKGNAPGRTIALRGDIDALPIQEETGAFYSSVNEGVMHACGHDCHATFMLAAAKLLKERRGELHGTVKIIFQEAEEIGAGAFRLLQSDLLDDVENIVALHVTQELDLGKFSVGYGVMSSFDGEAEVTLLAKPGQEKEENMILAAAQLSSMITTLALQKFKGEEQAVLVPTIIKKAQTHENQREALVINYNFRTLRLANYEIFRQIFSKALQAIMDLFAVEAVVRFWGPGHALYNDRASTDRAIRIIEDVFGKEAYIESSGMLAGEDFARYQEKIPGVFLHLGGAVNGNYLPLHTPRTMVDDRVLPIGVEFLLHYIYDYLQ